MFDPARVYGPHWVGSRTERVRVRTLTKESIVSGLGLPSDSILATIGNALFPPRSASARYTFRHLFV
jgi:hypothetical protein